MQILWLLLLRKGKEIVVEVLDSAVNTVTTATGPDTPSRSPPTLTVYEPRAPLRAVAAAQAWA